MKQSLSISRLPTIDEILEEPLQPLDYSTQKRNIAYLIQLKTFLSEIYNNYAIGYALGVMFQYNILRINSDIIESILYCAIRQKNIPIKKTRKNAKASHLINVAKTHRIITKITARDAGLIVKYRNDFHPEKQTTLHAKIDPSIFSLSEKTIDIIYQEIKTSLQIVPRVNQTIKKAIFIDEGCDYCQTGIIKVGELCPACGNIVIGF